MDQPNEEICKSLVKWLQKIVPNKSRNVSEICDGVAMLDALLQIAPEYFIKLEPKIKKDAGTNWRLKKSNLKKIVEAVIEYYQDVNALQLLDVAKPDVNKIGENNDPVELAKLLRLILVCAINCDRKQEYITKIMEMEESVQQNIMTAIQQLEDMTGGQGKKEGSFSSFILDNEQRYSRLIAELDSATKAKEILSQQYQAMEQRLQSLIEEKENLLAQNQLLKEKEARSPDTRKQIENLKEELLKVEVVNDDLKAKIMEQEKQILNYQETIGELQITAKDSSRLKDEVDALKESASKIIDLESSIQSYQKRLENYQDIKRNLQKAEEKNTEYLQRTLELEKELTRNVSWRTQCETYKTQVAELQQKLDEETQKSERLQFSYETAKSKMEALLGEKERLILERDFLREENEELKLGTAKTDHTAAVSQELTPTEMKEKLRFLERENRTLRNLNQESEAKQAQLDSASSRIERLQQQNRSVNQTVLKLEAQIDELKSSQIDGQASGNGSIVKEYKQKLTVLQEALNNKETELQVWQTKYNKSVEKAKVIAQQIDSKSNGGSDSSLRHNSQMKDLEGKLLATAFYKLGLSCQREAIDERLAALSAGQGQSFLARQRQATPRKNVQRYKSK